MKKLLFINAFTLLVNVVFCQEAIKMQSGANLTIQNGAELVLQGGLTLDNGSSLINNGSIFLKNNPISNISNWTDNSILGALTGTGIVIFNSTYPQQFTGPTSFYTVYINTDQLTINNDLSVSNLLRLIKGKVNTTNYVVVLINNNAASLENDVTNTGYTNSWLNGNFKRSIATNTSTYDFPVGNSERSDLLKFINNNITGPTSLTSSFVPKPGTDAGLNVTENGNTYTAVNSGGVWKLVSNTAATGGNYALQLYFNGFTGLLDNRFGILRRPDASSNAADWIIPTGSLLEPLNGTGRKVSDGFARRFNIPDFSQFGIGEFTLDPVITYNCSITGSSEVCKGSSNIYTAPAGLSSYNWSITGNGSIIGSASGSSINILASSAGTYTLTLQTMLNGAVCSSQKTVSLFECVNACSYSQGFYGNAKGKACYNNSGVTMTSTPLMINAFGATTSRVFGNVVNKRSFTLFKSDISNGNIYEMLPGGSTPKAIDIDKKPPFDGAYYEDQSTWSLVPIQATGSQKGKIRNILLAQTITLWFNIRNSNTLGSISLVDDTLVTKATASCGSNTPVGIATKFGLPHNVIVYLNGGNGYPATVDGLFQLANDVLGGVVTNISASSVNDAVDVINNAFEECRVLVGTIPYDNQLLTKTEQQIVRSAGPKEVTGVSELKVAAYPNPYKNHFQLLITSPVMGMVRIEFFTLNGQKVYEMNKQVAANSNTAVTYTGPLRFATLVYKVTIEKNTVTGIVLKPN